MIKIKDYIFNENEIREIKQCKNYLRLDLTYSGPYLHIDDATFDDIEWNYGTPQNATQNATQNKIDDEYIELSNKYQRLLNINEEFEEEHKELVETNYNLATKKAELEEENKTLKELNVCVGCNNNPDYKTRINKAVEYNNHLIEHAKYHLNVNHIKKSNKILKGSEE